MKTLFLISISSNKIITAFSWMLIHSLWQGLLLAVVAGILLMLTKRSTSVSRYNLMLTLFSAFIGLSVYTFIAEWNIASKVVVSPVTGNAGNIVPTLFSGNVYNIKLLINTFSNYFSANAPMIMLAWFVIFLFKSVKMIACLVYNNRIRSFQVYEPDKFWVDAVENFSNKLNIKKAVRLVQSGYIKMPVVVGHLKPVIIVPIGLMAGLPAEQVEAILLHELAHIRRNDYFVNFLQNIAETVFFFNPGLLWISTLLREERENCCDDIALEQTQNKVGFVKALISFKEHELYGSKYATAFPGKKNYLFKRISRILNNRSTTFGFGEKVFLMISVILLAFMFGTIALGEIKEPKRTSVKASSHAVNVPTPTDSIANKYALKAIEPVKYTKTKLIKKMQVGIVGIKDKISQPTDIKTTLPAKSIEILAKMLLTDSKQPITPVPIKSQPIQPIQAKEQLVVNLKLLAQSDQKLTRTYKALTDRDRSEQDQKQAQKDQQQALIDQKQAMVDQAEAIKNQTKARIDQEQALKSKQDADNGQTRLNEVQAKKNHEQEIRNEEQARLNVIQEKKNLEQEKLNAIQARRNEEQAIRNQEQAGLNDIQARKNQEKDSQDNASIKQ